MTTRELIARLQELDPSGDMLVLERRCSDCGPMKSNDWSQMTVYQQNRGEWYTREDYRLSPHFVKDPIDVIHFAGN